jgi:carboxymethylenebutenolidase
VCFYPTGLHNGALGADADAGSLARAGSIRGRLMIVFGSQDPHVPADARVQIVSALYAAGLDDLELHVYAGGEHAFMRDVGARYDPTLTDLALTEAVSFLSRPQATPALPTAGADKGQHFIRPFRSAR